MSGCRAARGCGAQADMVAFDAAAADAAAGSDGDENMV